MVEQSVKEIKKILTKKNKVLLTAESCTGGLISSYLTDIAGASNFVKQNFVTYSNSAKITLLDVNKETIEKFGVASIETAKEMAFGLLKKYEGDFALSTTGVLGPKLYDDGNPKGTVFIGISNNSKTIAVKYHSKRKTREAIKKDIAKKSLEFFLEFLQKNS